MKRIFVAMAVLSAIVSSCRHDEITRENEALPQLKKTNEVKKKQDSSNIGPVVITPPKYNEVNQNQETSEIGPVVITPPK